jgi:bifunctional non-homologous end joining protein LigD
VALSEYRRRRCFGITPEPRGERSVRRRSRHLAFVVQKHRASRLHYDFRLEWNGVLLSWAVPKGPSLDPSVKRLAMQTEDHPLDYAKFEGIIPEGEYGGGTVMVWDQGTWVPELPDVDASLRKGDLKFVLAGKKLRGSWVLVRTRGRRDEGGRAAWLLIKHRDAFASDEEVAASAPRSVVSRRLLAEIAWHEGGNVEKAAGADPPDEIRKLIKKPALVTRRKRGRKPSVWKSNRAGS